MYARLEAFDLPPMEPSANPPTADLTWPHGTKFSRRDEDGLLHGAGVSHSWEPVSV